MRFDAAERMADGLSTAVPAVVPQRYRPQDCTMQTECVASGGDPRVHVRLRFWQLQTRSVIAQGRLVEMTEEPVLRRLDLPVLLARRQRQVMVRQRGERVRETQGSSSILTQTWPLQAQVEVWMRPAGERLHQVHVCLQNTSGDARLSARSCPEKAQRRSFLVLHMLLSVDGGRFLSPDAGVTVNQQAAPMMVQPDLVLAWPVRPEIVPVPVRAFVTLEKPVCETSVV
ncbi:MAG: hypothetical protein ACYCW6_28470 [Candidatus Xenobia bacterium]